MRSTQTLGDSGCNTVPIEKGTETDGYRIARHEHFRCNTVPIEKGTETIIAMTAIKLTSTEMQHCPHREGD